MEGTSSCFTHTHNKLWAAKEQELWKIKRAWFDKHTCVPKHCGAQAQKGMSKFPMRVPEAGSRLYYVGNYKTKNN